VVVNAKAATLWPLFYELGLICLMFFRFFLARWLFVVFLLTVIVMVRFLRFFAIVVFAVMEPAGHAGLAVMMMLAFLIELAIPVACKLRMMAGELSRPIVTRELRTVAHSRPHSMAVKLRTASHPRALGMRAMPHPRILILLLTVPHPRSHSTALKLRTMISAGFPTGLTHGHPRLRRPIIIPSRPTCKSISRSGFASLLNSHEPMQFFHARLEFIKTQFSVFIGVQAIEHNFQIGHFWQTCAKGSHRQLP
jgi:hypothetical protein